MNKLPSTQAISRSSFVKVVTAMIGTMISAVIGIPAIGYLISPALRAKQSEAWIILGPLGDIPVGIPKPFNFTRSQVNGWEKTVTSHGVFVVRKDESQVMVLSNICTHLGCIVSWHPDRQHYVSPCHNGHFDILGKVVSGPPPRPLDEYVTKIENGIISIHYPPYKRS